MIPFKYNVRNLRVRWKTTLMTVLGTALLVASSCILFGLVEGLEHSLKVSGDPLDLIVLRQGATAETTGGFEGKKADELLTLGGILRDGDGPVGAKELLNIAVAERASGTYNNLIIRGVQPASRKLRPDFKIVGSTRGPRSAASSSSARRRSTASSACSPPAAARPRARSGPT